MGSIADTLSQLRAARDIVLHDPTPYPQVVAGILQVVSPAAQIEARRWGADFLAESFASPVVAAEVKQQMAVLVLDTLGGWLDRQKTMGQEEDVCVVKSAIQCAASIYPFVFRHTVTASDANVWKKMSDIKSTILGRMDTGNPGVRICCIKFATCVVQTQTPGTIADPRRPERNEISLALLPREHSVVSSSILEAQASGLLDRVLSVLQDSSDDALIVTAALNALAPLVQKRPSITAKIITAVLNFDPFKLTRKTMTGRDKIIVRSLTRTTMSFLLNNFKLAKNNIFAGRIQQHLERMKVTLNEAFSEAHQLKRRALDMPVDGLDDTKRQRLSAEPAHSVAQLQQPDAFAPLPDGPISLAQLFTLTRDTAVSTFPVQGLNADIITQLIPAVIQTLSQERIEQVVNAVRSRMDYLSKSVPAPASAVEAVKAVVGEDDDDDYDPTMNFEGDLEQVTNELDQLPREKVATDVAVGPFNLPSPTPLTVAARDDYSKTALTRVFETLAEIDKEIRSRDLEKDQKAKNKPGESEKGFNRLAASLLSGHDREGWLTLLTRLATRSSLHATDGNQKAENQNRIARKDGRKFDLSNGIRQALMNYIMENFRARIDVAIMWLSEEWYSERVVKNDSNGLPTYWHWTLRLFDAMTTYFDIRDGKILIRFLSEVPAINRDMLRLAKKIAQDPDRVQLTVNALLYLIMFRPPVREAAIDCVAELWQENQDAKPAAAKILAKYRPAVIEKANKTPVKEEA